MSPVRSLDEQGRLRHLLTLEGLPKRTILEILDTAESFVSVGEREIKRFRCAAARPWSTCSSNPPRAHAPPSRSRPSACPRMSSTWRWPAPAPARAKRCSTPFATSRPCTPTCLCAPRPGRRGRPDLPATCNPGSFDQRRRWRPCASRPGAARRLHHPAATRAISPNGRSPSPPTSHSRVARSLIRRAHSFRYAGHSA